jgi:glycosyltransferase involved in cell wall biosynthesis
VRLRIIDPGFEGFAGHHYELNRAIVAECGRRGIDVRIAAHERLLIDELPADRIFQHSIYDEVSGGQRPIIQQLTAGELASLEWQLCADDLLLMHSIARAHFIAVTDWIASMPADRRPRCVVLHNVGSYGAEWMSCAYEWSDEFRAAAQRLRAATHVTFGAVNEPLCHDWEVHSGCAAVIHPIPLPAAPAVVPRDEDRTSFAFLGGARHEKGFDLLPEIVATLIEATDADVLVQIAEVPPSSSITVERLHALARSPRVRLHHGAAAAETYRALAGSIGVMLLPYDAHRYRIRGSGLFFEALSAGLPLVLPAGTWMAEEWSRLRGGGVLFHDWTANDVAEAAVQVARSFDEHRARSRCTAPRWNASHSTAAFVDFILRT